MLLCGAASLRPDQEGRGGTHGRFKSSEERQFWFYLAREFGCTVAELQHRMTSREFSEWQAYFSFHPFGELREDYRAASIACIIANANRDPSKGEPFEVSDFLLKFEEDDPEAKQLEVEEKLHLWAITAGGVKSEQLGTLSLG